MRTIARGTFTGVNAELREQIESRVAAFKAARAAHAKTEGVPAPREDDLIEHLARTNEAFEIEPEPEQPKPLTAEQLAVIDLENKRTAAVRALEDRMLDQAMADPDAPQEVKDYSATAARAR